MIAPQSALHLQLKDNIRNKSTVKELGNTPQQLCRSKHLYTTKLEEKEMVESEQYPLTT